MQTRYPATALRLQQALERNADWIKSYIDIPNATRSVLTEYLNWLFEMLKDRVPPEPSERELDQMVRQEVIRIYGKFRDRNTGAHYEADLPDPAGERFQDRLANADELRASLECVPNESRELILRAFAATDDDISAGRDRLAARLGIQRNTLDQRLSRAYKRIRERMRGKRGPQKP